MKYWLNLWTLRELQLITLFVVLFGVTVYAWSFFSIDKNVSLGQEFKAGDLLDSRQIIDAVSEDTVIQYAVVGLKESQGKSMRRADVQKNLSQGRDYDTLNTSIVEDVSKRTINSRTFEIGMKDGKTVYQTQLTTGPIQTKTVIDGKWRDIKYATATPSDFTRDFPTARHNTGVVWADEFASTTANGDGYIREGNTSWAAARSMSSPAKNNVSNQLKTQAKSPSEFLVARAFIPVDLAALPASITVSAASLDFWVTAITDGGESDSYIVIDQALGIARYNQGSPANPEADFDLYDDIKQSDDLDLTSLSTSATGTFTINATGRTAIEDNANTGFVDWMIRAGHDFENVEPGGNNVMEGHVVENANPPFLNVTYTEGGGGGGEPSGTPSAPIFISYEK